MVKVCQVYYCPIFDLCDKDVTRTFTKGPKTPYFVPNFTTASEKVSKARLELAWPLRAAGSRPAASPCCATSTKLCRRGDSNSHGRYGPRGLNAVCLPIAPLRQNKEKWSGRRESNPHLLHGAEMLLSIELQPHIGLRIGDCELRITERRSRRQN